MTQIILTGHDLTIDQIATLAFSDQTKAKVIIDSQSFESMKKSREVVNKIVSKKDPVYGINTGFGALSSKYIPQSDLAQLQLNLIRSHCTGVGKPFSIPVVRAMMLLRANCLISGHSGINPSIVQMIVDFLNHDITPVVPEKGSVGASGDLAPLSHIALALIGEGEVYLDNKIISSLFAIHHIGKSPVTLGPKDGLALINGTAAMAALGSLACYRAKRLATIADICAALTLDAVKGTIKAYDPRISKLKPQPGQIDSCSNLNKLLENSGIIHSHDNCGKVQDPYSLRCVPQVHGACRQTIRHGQEVIDIELNSVTDNPLIFTDSDDVISGGNFHGEALALAMDYMSMGIAELCNISERRIEKMMNPTFSDLPAFLSKEAGLSSGLMIAHVTAAALASENKYLCHPASIDSIPTSTDKEDHVSMGVTSGRKLHEVLDNLKHCLAIELLCATQALDFQRPLRSSRALESVYELIRKHVHFMESDRVLSTDIERIANLIERDEIINAAKAFTGELH